MSTDTTCQINSSSYEDTFAIGKRLGEKLKGGEVIVLASDLGGGKTSLTKGIAEGLGSEDKVGSPTFTLSRIYKCRDGLYLHHFDFYRLNEAGVVGHELAEVIDDPNAVIVIEWGDIVSDALPASRVTINISRSPEGENIRCLDISGPPALSYVYANVLEEDKKPAKPKKKAKHAKK